MKELKCKRCKHLWIPRTENPKSCPHCNSRVWNKQKEGRDANPKKT